MGNMQSTIQSFLKMRWGLECIRLCRHPVTILVSSDFVRRIQIEHKSVGGKQPLLVVEDGLGSLSGLIAGSLSAFQKMDQGLLQVSYTTSTSEGGVILLKEYLEQRIKAVGSEPVRLNRLKSDGVLEELVYDPNQFLYPGVLPGELSPGKEAWILDELFNENRSSSYHYYPDALILTNINTRDILRLFEAVGPVTPPYQGLFFVFLGETSLNRAAWEDFARYMSFSPYASNLVLGINESIARKIFEYSGNGDWTTLQDAAQVISEAINATIFFFHENQIGMAKGDQCCSTELRSPIELLSLSRSIAGFSLGLLVDRCLQEVPDCPPELLGSFEDALRMAKIFADTRPEVGDFVTEEALLSQLGLNSLTDEQERASGPSLNGYLNHLFEVYRYPPHPQGSGKLFGLVQQDDDLVTSAAIDRLKRFGDWEKQERPQEERLIFLDLDLTLFDYTLAREKGARAALAELSINISLDRTMEIYHHVVEHWRGFEFLGLPNVRRLWNVETLYYLVYLFASREYRKQFDDFFALLSLLEEANDEETRDRVKRENSQYILMFSQALNRLYLDVQLQQDTRRAYIMFEEATAHLVPFSDTKDLLKTLDSLKGYHVFVLTEGSLSVQWEKIEKLGLKDLIKLQNVIVTEALSRPQALLQEFLLFEQELIMKRATGSNDREASEVQLDAIDFLNKMFGLFTYKRDLHFYGHAVHMAVKQISQGYQQNDFANVSPAAWDQLRPVKLATVGDRYSNDIKPLANIFGQERVLSIHLPYGKYLNDLPGPREPKPDFTVERLAAARNILVRDDPWQSKLPLPRPKHFYTTFDHESLSCALAGLVMPRPMNTIAEAILQDTGFSEGEIDELRGKVGAIFRGKTTGVSLQKQLQSLIP